MKMPGMRRPKCLPKRRAVGLVGDADELAHGRGVHRVEVRVPVVPGAGRLELHAEGEELLARAQPVGRWPRGRRRTCTCPRRRKPGHEGRQILPPPSELGRAVERDHLQFPLAVGGILGDQAAGGARGPAVLIVKPGLHVQLLSLVHAGGHAVHPLPRQVRRHQAHAAVHEEPAHAHPVHQADLAAEFGRVQPAVPGPERRATILAARIAEFLQNGVFHRGDLHSLTAAAAGGRADPSSPRTGCGERLILAAAALFRQQ